MLFAKGRIRIANEVLQSLPTKEFMVLRQTNRRNNYKVREQEMCSMTRLRVEFYFCWFAILDKFTSIDRHRKWGPTYTICSYRTNWMGINWGDIKERLVFLNIHNQQIILICGGVSLPLQSPSVAQPWTFVRHWNHMVYYFCRILPPLPQTQENPSYCSFASSSVVEMESLPIPLCSSIKCESGFTSFCSTCSST